LGDYLRSQFKCNAVSGSASAGPETALLYVCSSARLAILDNYGDAGMTATLGVGVGGNSVYRDGFISHCNLVAKAATGRALSRQLQGSVL
jgi:hypothetical protein